MMEFHIPDGFARFASQVERRFAVLLQKRVLTGIDVLQLRKWLNNFESDEERYLAAHLLDSLVLRTDKMLASSSEHVLQMLLPNALISCNRFKVDDLAEFISRMTSGKTETGIRFVAVDGTFEKTPGKSGAALIGHAIDERGGRSLELTRASSASVHTMSYAAEDFMLIADGVGFRADAKSDFRTRFPAKRVLLDATTLDIPELLLICANYCADPNIQHIGFVYVEPEGYRSKSKTDADEVPNHFQTRQIEIRFSTRHLQPPFGEISYMHVSICEDVVVP
ncbi:MAG TPA: hypothetical protein VJ654_10825 [Noviherbaspirillum sp.]|nr:hypothetical protein [Noviherbaspirillum sp.]